VVGAGYGFGTRPSYNGVSVDNGDSLNLGDRINKTLLHPMDNLYYSEFSIELFLL
jgi:hypothetical protein